MCNHVKFDSSPTKGVKGTHKLESAGTLPLWGGGVVTLTPKNKPPLGPLHMCCHIKFGSSVLKVKCINRRESQNGERWSISPACGTGEVDP